MLKEMWHKHQFEKYLERTRRYRRKVQEEVRRSLSGEKLDVYYPGIGGGEEDIDFLSVFLWVDPDSVVGIDLLPFANDTLMNKYHPDYADPQKAFLDLIDFLSREGKMVRNIKIKESDFLWKVNFLLDNRPREISFLKIPTDAKNYIPSLTCPVIYSRRTIGVVTSLPAEVMKEVKAVVYEGEMLCDTDYVQDAFSRWGFKSADMRALAGNRDVWSDNMRKCLLTRNEGYRDLVRR